MPKKRDPRLNQIMEPYIKEIHQSRDRFVAPDCVVQKFQRILPDQTEQQIRVMITNMIRSIVKCRFPQYTNKDKDLTPLGEPTAYNQIRIKQNYDQEGGKERAKDRYYLEGGQQRAQLYNQKWWHEKGGKERAQERYQENKRQMQEIETENRNAFLNSIGWEEYELSMNEISEKVEYLRQSEPILLEIQHQIRSVADGRTRDVLPDPFYISYSGQYVYKYETVAALQPRGK